jgi:phospholipase/carboxylesterase
MHRESPEVRTLPIEIAVEYAVTRPDQADTPPALLLILHGWGQTCRTIMRRFAPLRDSNLLLVAPQAPHPFYVSMDPKKVGFTWLTQYERDRAVEEVRQYIRRLMDRLASEELFDPHRVFIAGYSQGVSMAYRLAVSDGIRVAGLIACNGDLPPDVVDALPIGRRFPVLLVHGNADPLVPITKCDEAMQVLCEHGFEVDRRLHPGGHELPPRAVRQVGEWILSSSQ